MTIPSWFIRQYHKVAFGISGTAQLLRDLLLNHKHMERFLQRMEVGEEEEEVVVEVHRSHKAPSCNKEDEGWRVLP